MIHSFENYKSYRCSICDEIETAIEFYLDNIRIFVLVCPECDKKEIVL